MKVLCPYCGVKGAADDSYIGKMVKCPKCEATFVVLPEAGESLSEDVPKTAALSGAASSAQETVESVNRMALKIFCPHCGVRGTADKSYVGKKVKCPKCETVFEVLSEEKIALPDEVQQMQAEPSSLEAEVQNNLDFEGELLREVDDEATYDWLEDDAAGPVSEIPVEQELEDEISEELEEALKWTDIVDETERLSEERVEMGGEASFAAGEDVAIPGISSRDEVEKTVSGGTMLGPDVASTLRAKGFQGNDPELTSSPSAPSSFSILGVIKDAWRETKGAKASIWAGSCVMSLVIFVIGAAGTFLLPTLNGDMQTPTGIFLNTAIQVLLSVVSVVFSAGLLYMGIRKAAGDAISWKMVFKGFSSSGQIVLATLLQALLVVIGLLLLVLPGVYLAIGYGLTLPLILDRKMSAWEAMETSRKAIHKVWWKVAGVLVLMGIIYTVSAIPLGIGLIWTMPMLVVLAGVVYCRLFGAGKNV